jgi:hypothetical protein
VLIEAAAQRLPGPWSLTPDLASLCSTARRKFYASLGRQGPIHGPDAHQDRPEGRARPWGTSTSIGSSQPPAAACMRMALTNVRWNENNKNLPRALLCVGKTRRRTPSARRALLAAGQRQRSSSVERTLPHPWAVSGSAHATLHLLAARRPQLQRMACTALHGKRAGGARRAVQALVPVAAVRTARHRSCAMDGARCWLQA